MMKQAKKFNPGRQELEKMAAEFDKEFVADTFGPMTKEARGRLDRAKAKRGRPRKGAGVKVISVSVEKQLLQRSDDAAKRLGITRADLIDRGLHAVLAAVGEK